MTNQHEKHFQNHSYINLTTFRKTGAAVATPVWFVEMDGRLYVFTGAQTGKAKRIRANGKAHIAPSDARGKPLGAFLPARARLVEEDTLKARADELYRQKYGFARFVLTLLNRLRRNTGDSVLLEFTFDE